MATNGTKRNYHCFRHYSVSRLSMINIFIILATNVHYSQGGIRCYECFNIATIGSRDCLEPTTQDGNVIECDSNYNGCMKATMMATLKRREQVLRDWIMFRYCDYIPPLEENSTSLFLRNHQHYRGLDDCMIHKMIKAVLRDKTPFHTDITVAKVWDAAIFRCNTDKCNDQHGFLTTEDTLVSPNDTINEISFIEVPYLSF